MGLVIDAPVRLPDSAVELGEEWTREWIGAKRQRDNDGIFHYRQTASLQEIENGSQRARIIFETTGRLEISPDRNSGGEETVFEAKGSIVLDLKTGQLAVTDCSGTITSEFKYAGLKIVRGIEAKYEEQ